ncbi:MAG: DNA repair protein RecN [Gammaproteobacteria bacterium]
MLERIHIRDFAIIERLELDFSTGLNVLTGETGAGKSILVDALGLVLGDRADATTVRHGAKRAEISADFDLADSAPVRSWLDEHDLGAEGECIIRRVITAEGRSRGYVNGRSVPMATLKELGERLVDIHGQHEHQSLLRRDIQRNLLDNYAGNDKLLEQVASAYAEWRDIRQTLEELTEKARDRDDRLELLRHQVDELRALGLNAGELAKLEEEHDRLANSGRLLEGAQRALAMSYESEDLSAYQLLSGAARELESLADIDASLGEVRDGLNSALISLQEGAEELRRYLADLDMDPERRDWVEDRIGSAHQLARKHRVQPDDLTDLQAALEEELDSLQDADLRLGKLQAQLESLEKGYRELAGQLHDARHKAAVRLSKAVSEQMNQLGMPGGRFDAAVTSQGEAARLSPTGTDTIEFLVSANPGQPARPLAKVASGGELSRISLAIQVIAAHATDIPAMVFDEVDAGIGGGVAEIVGRQLRGLGSSRQVLCVTHLPQVASQAHCHFKVSKQARKESTRTAIDLLDSDGQVEELARMLGGMEITETTRTHAREMIERARTA